MIGIVLEVNSIGTFFYVKDFHYIFLKADGEENGNKKCIPIPS